MSSIPTVVQIAISCVAMLALAILVGKWLGRCECGSMRVRDSVEVLCDAAEGVFTIRERRDCAGCGLVLMRESYVEANGTPLDRTGWMPIKGPFSIQPPEAA